jgi:hypothetical protein
MGDRANIIVNQGDSGKIYLYTHWNGYRLPEILMNALGREERWDDEPYLTRIIASEVIRESGGIDSETGSGITTYMTDGEYAVIEVSVDKQTVSMKKHTWSFDEFIDESNKDAILGIWR